MILELEVVENYIILLINNKGLLLYKIVNESELEFKLLLSESVDIVSFQIIESKNNNVN